MEAKRKRFTLDLEIPLQRRLKVIAALKGVSMRQYCLVAVEKELARDESTRAKSLPFGEEALERLASLQAQVFGQRKVAGDSVELIRETRQSREKAR
mgnify:CR=1 FL=1